MKKCFVIYSANPYLLARLCTDLQMEGREPSNLYVSPFEKDGRWLKVYNSREFSVLNHNGINGGKDMYVCRTLTARNYLSVLTQIVE